MNVLNFKIIPSVESCDHQVRILVDGADWLGEDHLGIDPPSFFEQPSLDCGGSLLVGRCQCGCEGCGDVWVDVFKKEPETLWTNSKGLLLRFNTGAYNQVINLARTDFSWEDSKRTAERLVSGIFAGVSLGDGSKFDWASARTSVGIMTLSFSKSGAQKLFEIGWDGLSPEDALQSAKRFYEERVE